MISHRQLTLRIKGPICFLNSVTYAEDKDISLNLVKMYVDEHKFDFYHRRESLKLNVGFDTACGNLKNEQPSPEVRQELDNFNDKYETWLEEPSQLIEEINKIENKNLDLVLVNQENDQQLQEWRKKTEELIFSKDGKIQDLKTFCELLKLKIKQETQNLAMLGKEKAVKEKTVALENFDRIKAKVFGLYSNLKAEFDKNSLRPVKYKLDLDNQNMLDVLAEVEKLYYRFIKGCKKDAMPAILKNVL